MVNPGKWTEAELGYFAGIIDGEGSFCLHNHGTHCFASQLQVGSTDIRLMEWIKTHFGGAVHFERRTNPRHKPVWRWISKASELEVVIRAVLPYLIIKRQQAELFLAYRATIAPIVNTNSSTNDTPDDVKRERLRIHSELRSLNKRGA